MESYTKTTVLSIISDKTDINKLKKKTIVSVVAKNGTFAYKNKPLKH